MTAQAIIPKCPICGKEFTPGAAWQGANYCRAVYLAYFIREHPGLSTWEISQMTAMMFTTVLRGMARAREWKLVEWDEELRESGGKRFRYRISPMAEEIMSQWRKDGRA